MQDKISQIHRLIDILSKNSSAEEIENILKKLQELVRNIK